MAYTAPTTHVAGETLPAADYNVIVNDVIDLRSYQNRYVRTYFTTANFNLNSTTIAAWKSGGELDLTLSATAGDVISFTIDVYAGSETPTIFADFATIVSGTNQSFFGAGVTSPAGGLSSMVFPGSIEVFKGATAFKTLVSGDISSGNVTVRPVYRTSTATNRTIVATTNQPLIVYMRNLGPVTT